MEEAEQVSMQGFLMTFAMSEIWNNASGKQVTVCLLFVLKA